MICYRPISIMVTQNPKPLNGRRKAGAAKNDFKSYIPAFMVTEMKFLNSSPDKGCTKPAEALGGKNSLD